jgi:glutathione synthase/RimK-type ligase-like ATP-grasp enzyme
MRIALVTCERPIERDEDLDFLGPALRRKGVEVETPGWTDPKVDWSSFELAMISSTWDYCERLDEFRSWVRATDRATTLVNPAELLEWNLDKRYLLELEAAGVPTIPTVWIEPGGVAEATAEIAELGWEDVVIKPVIDQGARNLVRVPADLVEEMLERYDVATMAQPYLPSVAAEGEASLVHLGGELRHSLRRQPARGDFRVQPQYGGVHESERFGAAIRELAEGAYAVAPVEPLYARIDVVGTAEGPAVIGLELIEPALYLDTDPGSAAVLADALLAATAQ